MTDQAQNENDVPSVVTFKTGAELLVRLGIVPNMTREGVRRIAKRYADEWPFGPGKDYAYGTVSNAQTMATAPFLRFFREVYTPGGRGPDKAPRKSNVEPG